MITDIPHPFIRTILEDGGMPPCSSQACEITPIEEGGLAVTFKIIDRLGRICFLKIQDAEGARGGPFLKHLSPIDDSIVREHAAKRRHFGRKMIENVLEKHPTLVPRPCYFDLHPLSMTMQRLRKHSEGVVAELRLGTKYPARIAGMVATLWKEVHIQHIPPLPGRKDVWNPLDYSPENVSRCTAAIGELQEASTDFLTATIERKYLQGKGSPEEIEKKLSHKLQHEQRALIGFEANTDDFFSFLNFPRKDLQALGQEILKQVAAHLTELGEETLTKLRFNFLKDLPIPPEMAQLPFQKLLFIAERERWWSASIRHQGKVLDQLEQAKVMGEVLSTDLDRFLSLVDEVKAFKETYQRLEKLPQAIVPQDGHPFNFFINPVDRSTTMLDLEDLSMGVRFADLSTVYLFKILRGVVQNKITEDQAVEYLKAAIAGYNSKVSHLLSSEELELMADYAIGVFLNFLPQFGLILRMNPDELKDYNLAMSLNAFTEHFQLLKDISKLWKTILSKHSFS